MSAAMRAEDHLCDRVIHRYKEFNAKNYGRRTPPIASGFASAIRTLRYNDEMTKKEGGGT